MNKKFNFIFKIKKVYKIILYFLLFVVIIFFSYFSIPIFFNYSPQLIEKSFKINNDIIIENISKISYRIFPTPRLRVSGSNFSLKENALEVNESEIEIILNPINILNYKTLDYNKLIIKNGSTKINIYKTNKLLNYFKKNKLKIFLKENNLVFVKNKKNLLKINNSTIEVSNDNNIGKLSVNGIFLNHKITFLLNNQLRDGSNIIIKIPELGILSNIFLENKNNSNSFNGLINFEVLNNFFQFNFTKEKNIKINKGFVKNNLINLSFEGEVKLKPNFFLNLTFEPKILNMEKLFPIIQKEYFSDNSDKTEAIKKVNGSFTFKNKFYGDVVFENGKILFKNFKLGVNNSMLLDAKIFEFGRKGKIHFNILKTIEYRKNSPKELKMSGFMVPSTSDIIFQKVFFDKQKYTEEQTKNFQKKFKNEVTQKNLGNIFNDTKMSNFFNNFNN